VDFQRCLPLGLHRLSHRGCSAVGLVAIAIAVPLGAQQPSPPSAAAPSPIPEARAADVESVDAIITALYDAISGPAGAQRDWGRFRSLFAPGARLIPTGRASDGTPRQRVMTPEEYVLTIGPILERDGFYEAEIGRRTERYGKVVHLMSAYDSKRTPADPAPFARGINSIQLWSNGTRWFVVTIFWEAETPANPIPASFFGAP
jgi:hypothetical protein